MVVLLLWFRVYLSVSTVSLAVEMANGVYSVIHVGFELSWYVVESRCDA